MDGSKFPSLPDDVSATTGLDAGLVVAGVRQLAIPPIAFTASSITTVVYCGDVEQVGEGFVIALRAMGVVADLPECGFSGPDNKED
jgi:hypothetical protein